MSELVPLRADPRPPAELEAAAALVRSLGREPLSPGRRQQLWTELVSRADRPRPGWHRAVWAVPVAAALLLAGAWVRGFAPRPNAAQTAAAQEPSRVAPAPGARYRLASGNDRETLTLEEGRVEVHVRRGERPMHVAARELTLVVTEGRFLTEVERGEASVTAFEGSVVVRRGDKDVALAAGESVRASDPRLAETAPPLQLHPVAPLPVHRLPAAPVITSCPSRAPMAERLACLEHAAQGAGLSAQNAQYVMALLTERSGDASSAVGAWRRYAERFPDGVLAPEARLALINDLVKLERYPEALAEAEAFLARFPREPVGPDVLRLTENLRRATRLPRSE
jgi:hypothetical protein